MKYRSTRGDSKLLSFQEAVLQGLAPDGGLYIPLSIPQFTLEEISSFQSLSFEKLAYKLYRPFIDESEIPDKDLQDLCTASYGTFSHPERTPTAKLPSLSKSGDLDNLWILELFHGPTFAFKDVALQFLGNLFEYFLLKKKGSKITVLGATSGDTGGAAIYGLRGKENIQVFILHPHKRISPIQEAQMTSVLDSNGIKLINLVHNVAIEGSFDDCQDIVKELFSDKDFKEKYKLGAINSINWARILAQTTYYFYSFFSVMKQIDVPGDVASYLSLQKIQFSVPSGNFGDVLAGFFAKQMGLPIHHFIVATNENDILNRFLKSGSYQKQLKTDLVDPVKQTLSPAMDILISSNFERLLWYLVANGRDVPNTPSGDEASRACEIISGYMKDLREKGGFTVDSNVLKLATSMFSSDRVDDATTSDAIRRYYHNQFHGENAKGYVLDPHTAVGVVAAENFVKSSNSGIQTVCLSTASPGKFPGAVMNAINNNPPDSSIQMGFKPIAYKDIAPNTLVKLEGLPQRMTLVTSGGKYEKALEGVKLTLVETLANRSGKL